MTKTSTGYIRLTLNSAQEVDWARRLLEAACLRLQEIADETLHPIGDVELIPIVESMIEGMEGTKPEFDITTSGSTIRVSARRGFDVKLADRWLKAVYKKFNIPQGFGGDMDMQTDIDGLFRSFDRMAEEMRTTSDQMQKSFDSFFDRPVFDSISPRGMGRASVFNRLHERLLTGWTPFHEAIFTTPWGNTPRKSDARGAEFNNAQVRNLSADIKVGTLNEWIRDENRKAADQVIDDGVEAQIRYLLSKGWTVEQIKKASEQ